MSHGCKHQIVSCSMFSVLAFCSPCQGHAVAFAPPLFCRYRHPRGGKAYGQAVYKHLDAIRKRLPDQSPNRQAWLRLMKDIADYCVCANDSDWPLIRSWCSFFCAWAGSSKNSEYQTCAKRWYFHFKMWVHALDALQTDQLWPACILPVTVVSRFWQCS